MEINGKYCRKLNSWPLSLTTFANSILRTFGVVAILQRCQFAYTLVFTLRRQQTIPAYNWSIGPSHMQFYPITVIDDNERCQCYSDDVSRVTFIYWNNNNNSA